MTDINKLIEEEARKEQWIDPCSTSCERQVAYSAFIDGANFILSKESELLYAFFLWFRENGEKYLNQSIEKMIDIYLKEKNNG